MSLVRAPKVPAPDLAPDAASSIDLAGILELRGSIGM